MLADYPDLCLSCHKELREIQGPAPETAAGALPGAAGGTAEAPGKQPEPRYVHAPEEIGKCRICHLPHESSQESLMKEPIQPLCGRCHSYRSEAFDRAHLGIDADRMDCRKCHTPHVARTEKLFKNVLHPPFARQECKDCHLVEKPGESPG
jgi:predicted CXXCH cytochrome family protein